MPAGTFCNCRIWANNNQTTYYEYDSKLEGKFPFTVVGYYEKIKAASLGKRFVFKNAQVRKLTGKNPQPGELWTCTDVLIENEDNKIAMSFTNSAGTGFTMPYNEVAGAYGTVNAFTEAQAADYKQRFGNELWNSILYNQLKNGMSEEMAKITWGGPKRTNHLNDGTDQWVYDDHYLYFKKREVGEDAVDHVKHANSDITEINRNRRIKYYLKILYYYYFKY